MEEAVVTLTVVATGTEPLAYQWWKDGAGLPGAIEPSLRLGSVRMADAGGYSVVVRNAGGSVTSSAAVLRVGAYLFTTVAGKAGQSGSTDGRGAEARFNWPKGLVVDPSGTDYVADSGNDAIRKITPLAGDSPVADQYGPVGGYADGIGSAARFHTPCGVAVDGAGNIYVADTLNNTLRKGTWTLLGDAAPAIRLVRARLVGGDLVFSWAAQAGKAYRVQFADMLPDGVWLDAGPLIMAIDDKASFAAPYSASRQRFYRVQAVP